MSREIVTPGSPITWAYLNRSFSGRAVELMKVSDKDGSISITTPTDFSKGLTKAGASVLAGNPVVTALVAGNNGAHSTVLAGVSVGDKVASVIDLTAVPAVDQKSHFESTISVAGHIQQTGTDLSASTALLVTVVKQS